MDIEKLIQKTSLEADRLQKQAEQEKAMMDVLPVRFEENLLAFERFIPDIHKQFKNYTPSRAFRFFCNENGIPNLLWLDDGVAFYGNDPYQQSREQIEHVLANGALDRFKLGTEKDSFNQIHVQYLNKLVELFHSTKEQSNSLCNIPNSIPFALVFGVGLGYHLGYLFETCHVNNIVIVEPDLDLFYASLFTFDWAPLLEYMNQERISASILLGQDEETLTQDLISSINRRGAFLVSAMFAYWHYPSERIFKLIDKAYHQFYLVKMGWGFFDDNIFALSHGASNIAKKTPFLLKGKTLPNDASEIPVFVVGNGPSLDAALPVIKSNSSSVIIVCCGSAITALHKEGIKPDIYVAIERTKGNADFLHLLNDEPYLKDILFLSTDVVHPKCLDFFDHVGLGFKPNEPIFALLTAVSESISKFVGLQNINPLVGNTGASYAMTLGFKNVYLFGLDNGYKDELHHHSKSSAYYDESGNHIKALTDVVSQRNTFTVPGNFGGDVISNNLFGMSIEHLSTLVDRFPNVNCYNCSDGALIQGAMPLYLDAVSVPALAVNKKNVIELIYTDFFEPYPIEYEELESALDYHYFDEVVDKVIADWQSGFSGRVDLVNKMVTQFEFLNQIAHSKQHFIYRVLVGSFNYYFAVLTSMAYGLADPDLTKKMMNAAINIFIEFLLKAKEKYRVALQSADSSQSEILHHFRKN